MSSPLNAARLAVLATLLPIFLVDTVLAQSFPTRNEIAQVRKIGPTQVAPESVQSLDRLLQIAAERGFARVWIALHLEYNPDLAPGTPAFTAQQVRIERKKRGLIETLRRRNLLISDEVDEPTIGPAFAVKVAGEGVMALVGDRRVSTLYGEIGPLPAE